MRPTNSKYKESEKHQRKVEEFLKNGGTIQQVETTLSVDVKPNRETVKKMEWLRRNGGK